jgi:Ca-activated chloride channel family protein
MARYGRGEVQYVGLQDDGSAAAKTFEERIQTPVLTDIEVDWNGMPVTDVFPARIPDLFSAKPVILSARYPRAASGLIRLKGKVAGKPFVREIALNLPGEEKSHDVLATLWARRKVADIMASDFRALQYHDAQPETKSEITRLGIEFRLMTQYTSFIAVEDRVVNTGGKPTVVAVPVEMPEGVSYQGVYGSTSPQPAAPGQSEVARMKHSYGGISGSAGGHATAGAPRAVMARPATPAPVTSSAAKDELKTVETRRLSKLHPDLLTVGPTATVKVEVWLNVVNADVIAKLKKAGLTILTNPSGGALVTGSITGAQLAQLEAIDEVRFISPLRK